MILFGICGQNLLILKYLGFQIQKSKHYWTCSSDVVKTFTGPAIEWYTIVMCIIHSCKMPSYDIYDIKDDIIVLINK